MKFYKNMLNSLPYTGEIQYDSEFKGKDKPIGVATIYIDPLVKSHEKI